MRAFEFITEDSEKVVNNQVKSMRGVVSLPGINLNSPDGSPYLSWRFGVAMAGAPDQHTPPFGMDKGGPLLAAYTDEDMEIITAAAKMVGAGKIDKLTSDRSTEEPNTQKISPINPFAGYKK